MQIGQVAKNTGLTPDAIRFYERCGLVEKPQRTAGGFRIYRSADIEHLNFVQACQRLGFSLEEVRELLELRRAGGHACAEVRTRLEKKLRVVQNKVRELQALEKDLLASLSRCKRQLGRHARPTGSCPLLADPCSERKGVK